MFLLSVEDGNVIRFAKINAAHQKATSIDPSVVEGRTPHEAFPTRMADTVRRNYMRCVTTRQDYSYEELLQLPGGEMWWQTLLSPLITDDRVVGVIGIARDITPAKDAQRNLAATVQEVSRINSDLQTLTSTTAHDLRGPLRQVKLVLDMVGDGFQDLGDNKLELLRTGVNIVDKALDLIDTNLQHVTRTIDVDKTASPVDMGHWFSDIIAILDPLARLDIQYPEVTIECEKFVLDIGLRNLIDNATKFASSKIAIDIEPHEDGLIISVSDDGPGFKDGQYKIGEPPPTARSQVNVSGLGLSTTRSLVEARQGKLWIDEPRFGGGGATVSITLKGRMARVDASR